MRKKRSVAVLGAGFSGLAAAYLLAKGNNRETNIQVDVFDPSELGCNASGISAGLLHHYPGAHATMAYRGAEGREATLQLVRVAESALGKPVAYCLGMLRIAVTDEQKNDYLESARRNADVRWLEARECLEKYPHLAFKPGIFVESAYLMRTKQYLEGLWAACASLGVAWNKESIGSLSALENYDAIVVAAGAAVTSIAELSDLPIRPVKGQILKIRLPDPLPPLPFPINSKAYLVQDDDPKECLVGATFERKFKDDKPDLDFALSYLRPKMTDVIPDLKDAEVISCKSAIRAQAPNHLPFIRRINQKTWVLTGMGSKGLLYHALYAKELAEDVLNALV